MTNDQEAIQKAVDYLNALSKLQAGTLLDHPDNIRLETIQQHRNEWAVVLSYMPKQKSTKKSLADILDSVRRFKEFTINRKTGAVTAMRDPTLATS